MITLVRARNIQKGMRTRILEAASALARSLTFDPLGTQQMLMFLGKLLTKPSFRAGFKTSLSGSSMSEFRALPLFTFSLCPSIVSSSLSEPCDSKVPLNL